MLKGPLAASPDEYVRSLSGWQRERVETLRNLVRSAEALEEVVKWGHLVYQSNGPVALIRAEEFRVLLGFWRGQRLGSIEPRLKPGGKYEMATLVIEEATPGLKALLSRAAQTGNFPETERRLEEMQAQTRVIFERLMN
jgi:hypothetical protein